MLELQGKIDYLCPKGTGYRMRFLTDEKAKEKPRKGVWKLTFQDAKWAPLF